MEYDPFVTTPELSNPWLSDDPSLWDLEARYRSRNMGLLAVVRHRKGSHHLTLCRRSKAFSAGSIETEVMLNVAE